MLVQVDEAGRDDVTGGVDDARAGERRLGDRRDRAAADADVAHGVEARLGIHHPAVGDDEVVALQPVDQHTRRPASREDDGTEESELAEVVVA